MLKYTANISTVVNVFYVNAIIIVKKNYYKILHSCLQQHHIYKLKLKFEGSVVIKWAVESLMFKSKCSI